MLLSPSPFGSRVSHQIQRHLLQSMPATRAIQQCASWRTQIGGYARGYHECFASLTALQIPLRPPHAGPPARILCIGGACRELTNLPRTGSSSMARRETLAAPMRSVDRCETCQPRTEADGKVVTESNLSLRVPARVAAVLHGCRSPTAFRTGAPELDDLGAMLTGGRTLCARASMPYGPPDTIGDRRARALGPRQQAVAAPPCTGARCLGGALGGPGRR